MHKGLQELQIKSSQRGLKILQTGAPLLSPAPGYSHSSANKPHGKTCRFLEINSAAILSESGQAGLANPTTFDRCFFTLLPFEKLLA